MTLPWRAAVPPLCLVLILAVYTGWHAWRGRIDARRLVYQVQDCRTKAEQGNAEAEATLASFYRDGRGLPQDDALALAWYRKSAEQGFAGGEAGLGHYYHYGIGVPQDDAQALYWYRLAANQGDANAETAMGTAYFRGNAVTKDDAEAVRWFRKAADQGYPLGEYDLGWMYLHGRGVRADRPTALRLYRSAAQKGDPAAQSAVTRSLSRWGAYTLLFVLLWNLWIVSEFLYEIPRLAHETPRRRRDSVVVGVMGIVSAVLVSLTWYGYTHHKILCLGCGMNVFSACRWLLVGFVLAICLYSFRRKPNPVPQLDQS